MQASEAINNQKSNRLVTQGALERAGDIMFDWWDGAFLSNCDDSNQRFFMEAAQTLSLLIEQTGGAVDILDAMKMHRIGLKKDQGLRAWEPVIKTDMRQFVQAGSYET